MRIYFFICIVCSAGVLASHSDCTAPLQTRENACDVSIAHDIPWQSCAYGFGSFALIYAVSRGTFYLSNAEATAWSPYMCAVTAGVIGITGVTAHCIDKMLGYAWSYQDTRVENEDQWYHSVRMASQMAVLLQYALRNEGKFSLEEVLVGVAPCIGIAAGTYGSLYTSGYFSKDEHSDIMAHLK